jgi:hypothetical protein
MVRLEGLDQLYITKLYDYYYYYYYYYYYIVPVILAIQV